MQGLLNCAKNRKGERTMSEKEEKIIQAVANALPHMSEFDKGYMLGIAESNASNKKKALEEPEQKVG